MAERLAAITLDPIDPTGDLPDSNPWALNRPERIPVLRERLADMRDPKARLGLRVEIAAQLLLAGSSEEALREFEALEADLVASPLAFSRDNAAKLQGWIGIAALRLGEQENCLAGHHARSCIFPLQGRGVHAVERGSRRAAEAFANQLALEPDDLGARWLLNLAFMASGEYPEGVPEEWLLPPELFASEYDIPTFPDVAPQVGVNVVGLAGGSIMDDFDGDGRMDLLSSSWGLHDQMRFFRNDGSGRFVDRTVAAGLEGEVGGLNLSHADYDNDGDPDVLVLRGAWLGEEGCHPDSLLRNSGDGRFEDVTEEAGILTFHPTHTGVWADFDRDGHLDLFIGNEERSPLHPHPSQLYRSNGDGTFEDVATAAGLVNLGFVKGAAWGDYDGDGDPDLYVSRFGQDNLLFRNDVDGSDLRFTDVTAAAVVAEPRFSFATWFWDYDNDGRLDLWVGAWDPSPLAAVVAEFLGSKSDAELPKLYRNNGDGTFEDVTARAGLARGAQTMASNYGDIDNDGFLDLYLGTGGPDLRSLIPNRMFRNDGGRRFQDVTTAGGFGHLQKGHGISFGDIDNDGDQDIQAVMGGWFTGDVYNRVLFENPGSGNHWVTLVLEGTRSNRSAVGTRIRIGVEDGPTERSIFATVSTGGSFGSSTLQQEIGLGSATRIETLEIEWPSGARQSFRNLGVDGVFAIREGDPDAVPVPREPVRLDHGSH
jgi:hypothetical protein